MDPAPSQASGRGAHLYDISHLNTSKKTDRAAASNYVYYSYASKIKNSLRLG